MHTLFSDGVWTASQLCIEAAKRGIQALSITDHDTVEAYPDAFEQACQNNVVMIPGIELSSHDNHTTVHVLGYSFDLNSKPLLTALSQLKRAREIRIEQILERLRKRNVNLDIEDIKRASPHGQLGRPHIAALLVEKGYVSSINQAFDTYLSDTQMGSLKLKVLTTLEAIDLIHQANGFAVLAHPHQITKQKKLREILKHPFDGIEAYYAHFPLDKAKPYLDHALTTHRFATGGSDFHRPTSYSALGSSFTPEAVFNQLYERHQQNQTGI
jgi:predicted metal-dependent phosphoesterase TrpH